ncbi:MAG TPA: hypothetical protein PLD47_07140 [Aggregatilineales bacterium]|nr:hypothetical protein [Anaerolineales bacterium]HRE47483.1 hypothetical protein [Aggregatilineales bacterium]
MITDLRRRYNAAFTEERYNAYIADINSALRYPMDFHLCETPLFLPRPLMAELVQASLSLTRLVSTPDYLARAESAIPPGLNVPGEIPRNHFIQYDFALCYGEDGQIVPRLIELQGFPTLFGFQWLLATKTRDHFEIVRDLLYYANGHTEQSYLDLFRRAVVADHDPENVILMEIHPEEQKTRIDFAATEKLLGIHTVCLTKVLKRGTKLAYKDEKGREIPITRIYNRVIFDELERHNHDGQYRLTDEVDVTWAGHPNWFFKLSKYSLPLIQSSYVPEAHFLSDLTTHPHDLSDFVLKPLYSYSGIGVELDVTPERLNVIPLDQRGDYILQRKIDYAPVVETPDDPARAEIRLMLIWLDDAPQPEVVATLVRMSKGRMMGTRYNKDRRWVGSTLAYYPQDE